MHMLQSFPQSVEITIRSAMLTHIMSPQIVVIPPAMLTSFPDAMPHIGIMGSTTPPVSGPLMTTPPIHGHIFLDSPNEMDIVRMHALEQEFFLRNAHVFLLLK